MHMLPHALRRRQARDLPALASPSAPDVGEGDGDLTAVAEAAGVFVVDTNDLAELRRRCPELFSARTQGGGVTR